MDLDNFCDFFANLDIAAVSNMPDPPVPVTPDWGALLGNVQFSLAMQNFSGPKFNGDSRKFRRYQKDIQRMYYITGGKEGDAAELKTPRLKQIAFFLSEGTVSEAIRRRMAEHPAETWDTFMKELQTRYSPIADANCAQALLRNAFV